ncbi:MAG: aminopeptidase P family N-terminal domain-containing protein, partial [Dongiaceae bacterium]
MNRVVPDAAAPADTIDAESRSRPSVSDHWSNAMWMSDTEPTHIDGDALRRGRLARLRRFMAAGGYAALVLFDPYNQRYATGSRNMFGYFLRNSSRYFFVPTDGPVILFEYPQSYHVSTRLDTVDEARPSRLVWS